MHNSTPKKVDYIIIGQGLAGTILSHLLQKEGKSVEVVCKGHEQAASKVAAGIINPITGWRFVKTWLIDELIPSAKLIYKELEQELGINIWEERTMVRAIKNIEEENQWILKTSYPDYQAYCGTEIYTDYYPTLSSKIKHFRSFAEIKQCIQVDVPQLINSYRSHLLAQKILIEEEFNYEKLEIRPDSIVYNNIQADKIIFCEGAKATNNPFFNYLPFNLDKGELLIVRIPHLNLTHKIFKNIISIAPLENDLYWVGATNDWTFEDDQPSASKREHLIAELNYILQIPFEVIDHQAALRPTVKDRRPFIGLHPQHPTLAIFNGLGTKGTSLAPYFGKMLVAYLLENHEMEATVDIKRYINK